jgi:hypothetical protein
VKVKSGQSGAVFPLKNASKADREDAAARTGGSTNPEALHAHKRSSRGVPISKVNLLKSPSDEALSPKEAIVAVLGLLLSREDGDEILAVKIER